MNQEDATTTTSSSFPRGGKKKKKNEATNNNESKKRPHNHGGDDFLFGRDDKKTTSSRRTQSKKQKTAPSSSSSLLPIGGGGVVIQKNNQYMIEALSFQKLLKGTRLLGVVREVHEQYAVVSLPNLLTGYILKRENDPIPLTRAVSTNQMLSVVVIKTAVEQSDNNTTRRRIQVSALPSAINTNNSSNGFTRGRILSIEDHGCLVDLGNGIKGFLKFDDIEGGYTLMDDDSEEQASERRTTVINVGRLYDYVIINNNTNTSSSILSLSLPSIEKLAHTQVSVLSKLTLSSLQPNMLVQARVEQVSINGGLLVAFHNNTFRGSIEQVNVGGYFVPPTNKNKEWTAENLFLHKTVPARIIAVDLPTKTIRLSMQPHVLNMSVASSSNNSTMLPPVGSIVENAVVLRLDPGVGALLALPSSNDDDDATSNKTHLWPPLSKNEDYVKATHIQAAYLHISKATSSGRIDTSTFNKTYAPSTKHTLRILSTGNLLENVASCATAKSILEAHVLVHADLVPGKVYKQVMICGQLSGGSIMVDFGMGVRGLIPKQHLFDTTASGGDFRARLIKEKYAVGSKIDVRVLSVDVASKKCLVTAKKSLVRASDSVTKYEGLKKGQHLTGYISRMDDRNLYVTFYNKVYGRVTARSLAAELGIEDHRVDYHVGDVVKCRVISCKRRGDRSDDDEEENDDEDHQSGRKRGHWELNLSLSVKASDEKVAEQGEEKIRPSDKSNRVDLHSGAILPSKCMKVIELVPSKEKKDGGFIPGHAIVSIKSKYILKDDSSSKALPYVECKLPFDQLKDTYSKSEIESAEALDELARKTLTVGKKIHQSGLVLADPKKSADEYSSGLGRLPILSLREKLIATAEASTSDESGPDSVLLPSDDTHLFMGAVVQGYVTQVNPRHGSFVRFLDRVTGLAPKLKNGLMLPKYGTVTCRVVALDVSTTPMKILLKPVSSVPNSKKASKKSDDAELPELKPGDEVGDVQVVSRNAARVRVKLLDRKFANASKIRARVHVTMSDTPSFAMPTGRTKKQNGRGISHSHPFFRWPKGAKISGLVCAAVDIRKDVAFVELTNRDQPVFVESAAELKPGTRVSAFVTGVPRNNAGLSVEISPGISGFIPGLEICNDARVLNDLKSYFPLGVKVDCRVIDEESWRKRHGSSPEDKANDHSDGRDVAYLSAVLDAEAESPEGVSVLKTKKPVRGDLVVGKINRKSHEYRAPALMLELRGGYTGRCCITELQEMDDWSNMPLGRAPKVSSETDASQDKVVVTDEDEEHHEEDKMDVDEESHDGEGHESDEDEDLESDEHDQYAHGTYVQCRVLAGIPSQPMVEVSLRPSRLEGDLDDDELPEEKDLVQGFVIDTNKKGCFVRLARCVEGRVTLKELCDGFLPDPASSFPMGRLVVGKVKSVQPHKPSSKKKKNAKDHNKATVDLDMRESVLLESQDKLMYEDIEVGSKHKGTVTRLESYGVFVRLDNSDVSGLAHKSECSDNYIKNLADLYDPGDFVKVLVVKKDEERKTIGFSLKASHFRDDVDSDDDSSVGDEESEMDEVMEDALASDEEQGDELDSDDENFVSKLAQRKREPDGESSSESGEEESEEGSDSSDESDAESPEEDVLAIDTNVGFDWGAGDPAANKSSEDESSSDSSDDGDDSSDEEEHDTTGGKASRKSRKKAAARRQEEQEISRRETALADGTADENPETAADFERLLATEPNRSEHWIRYMAYHLSLADVTSARSVAERAFDRIEFRQEGEKLNVWTALLTLELKYGDPKGLQETVDRACQHNNPKQVYLRLCELVEREVDSSGSSAEAVARADQMYEKMCKKFKGKKTVWIAHLHYLIKSGRHQEAQALLKRALISLPQYKHVETMSKFAQLEMEHGSMERGRTIMDGLLAKYPKRLDLLFVYVDKEVKAGETKAARALLEGASQRKKLSDKQMKSLFKKWYRVEEEHGTDESKEHVKDAARAYVERTK